MNYHIEQQRRKTIKTKTDLFLVHKMIVNGEGECESVVSGIVKLMF